MKRNLLADIAERALWTFAQAYLGLWIASGAGIDQVTDLSMADKALISVLPMLLSVVKGVAASRVGASDSAATLPADLDPAPGAAHRDTGRAALSLLTVVTLIAALLAVFAGPAAAGARCSAPTGSGWQTPC